MSKQQAKRVKSYLLELQESLKVHLLDLDSTLNTVKEGWDREEGGGGESIAFSSGSVIEKGGVNFSDVYGKSLPKSATQNRPELEGAAFRAMGVSVVFHPDNPHVPTSHANVRYFEVKREEEIIDWWFGGGFDLTPYYPYIDDVIDWHKFAKSACDPFGKNLYTKLKNWCDEYFYLPHRRETRGVGGIFFDDFNDGGFEKNYSFIKKVGETFKEAYFVILNRRKSTPFTTEEKRFQKYRRGRYAEFNLVYDRGTHFGLQSGGRTESILMSMPPEVIWEYGWKPQINSREDDLYKNYLKPRNWLEEE